MVNCCEPIPMYDGDCSGYGAKNLHDQFWLKEISRGGYSAHTPSKHYDHHQTRIEARLFVKGKVGKKYPAKYQRSMMIGIEVDKARVVIDEINKIMAQTGKIIINGDKRKTRF